MWGINVSFVLLLALCVTVEGRSAKSKPLYCPNPDGVYPLSSRSCNEYIVCIGGTAYHKICSSGLAFNEAKRSCDLQKNVRCDNSVETTTQPDDEVSTIEKNKCPKQNGTFPMSCGDCKQYMLCNKGEATYMDCPPGLAYDTNKHSCDWSQNVACRRTEPCSTRNPAPKLAPTDFNCKQRNGYNRMQDECKSYIFCQENVAYKASCPEGHHFNPEAKYPDHACAYSPKIQCAGGTDEYNRKGTNQYPWYSINPMSYW